MVNGPRTTGVDKTSDTDPVRPFTLLQDTGIFMGFRVDFNYVPEDVK